MVIRHFGSVLMWCLRVGDWDGIDAVDLPEVTSIQMGVSTFSFGSSDDSALLVMRSVICEVE